MEFAIGTEIEKKQSTTEIINDFIIVCSDDIACPVNKELFCKKSSVFKTIFDSEVSLENGSCIHIHDIDSLLMNKVIGFIYAGSADWSVEVTIELLFIAKKYEIIDLKCECHDVLMAKIDYNNVFEILEVADAYNFKRLEGKALAFIVK